MEKCLYFFKEIIYNKYICYTGKKIKVIFHYGIVVTKHSFWYLEYILFPINLCITSRDSNTGELHFESIYSPSLMLSTICTVMYMYMQVTFLEIENAS